MSHLDEGQLAALFDDELEPDERRSVESHLSGCPECRALWEEIRLLAGEADRLVASVELPPKAVPARPVAGKGAEPAASTRALPLRTFAWAATVILAIGLGYSIRGASRFATSTAGTPAAESLLAERVDQAAATGAASAAAPAAQPASDLRQAPPPREEGKAAAQPPAAPKPLARANSTEGDAVAAPLLPSGNAPASPPAAVRDATAPVASSQGTLQPNDGFAKGIAPAHPAREARAEQAIAGGTRLVAVDLERAVNTLDGSIRLVDGLSPERVLSGPGQLIPGADPSVEVVRVVYLDPPGRELWLDQQRPRSSTETGRRVSLGTILPGDTILAQAEGGPSSIRWLDQHGFLLSLTGFLPGDSLRAMIPRVH